MQYPDTFDVLVIGGGHAGTEAALAAARSGARTLLVTHSIETIGQMSCNPAIGGIGKGHLVREIDALGGVMARAADAAAIQLRTLNARKGPAVRATRAQCDRNLYRAHIRRAVENRENLAVFQAAVDDLLLSGDRVIGCRTAGVVDLHAGAVVLTTGTFLAAQVMRGRQRFPAGRSPQDLPQPLLADPEPAVDAPHPAHPATPPSESLPRLTGIRPDSWFGNCSTCQPSVCSIASTTPLRMR